MVALQSGSLGLALSLSKSNFCSIPLKSPPLNEKNCFLSYYWKELSTSWKSFLFIIEPYDSSSENPQNRTLSHNICFRFLSLLPSWGVPRPHFLTFVTDTFQLVAVTTSKLIMKFSLCYLLFLQAIRSFTLNGFSPFFAGRCWLRFQFMTSRTINLLTPLTT